MSALSNSRRSSDWTLTTPIIREPARIGTDSIATRRFWSTPRIHWKRGSWVTSGTTSGCRWSATQPVTPSPTFIRVLLTFWLSRPLVAVSTRSSSVVS